MLPKLSLCGWAPHGHELDAVDIAAEGTRDNRIFEDKASLACKPLYKHSLALLARRSRHCPEYCTHVPTSTTKHIPPVFSEAESGSGSEVASPVQSNSSNALTLPSF
jgi:hypothetical protein